MWKFHTNFKIACSDAKADGAKLQKQPLTQMQTAERTAVCHLIQKSYILFVDFAI